MSSHVLAAYVSYTVLFVNLYILTSLALVVLLVINSKLSPNSPYKAWVNLMVTMTATAVVILSITFYWQWLYPGQQWLKLG